MNLHPSDLRLAAHRAADAMPGLEQNLNAADAKLGDGDTGGMLARLIEGFAAVDVDETDLGASFILYAKAATVATGSSLGTLCATALMAMGKTAKGQPNLPLAQLGDLLAIGRDAMLQRGQTALGDKTVIDALDAVSRAVVGQPDWTAVTAAAVQATDEVLRRFRDLPIKTGRARMFGDKSQGLDDPGMLAFTQLTQAVAGRP